MILLLSVVALYVKVGMTVRDCIHVAVVLAALLLTLTAGAFVKVAVEKRIGMIKATSLRGTVVAVTGWLMVGAALLFLCALFFLYVAHSFPL
jgi:hypothetical protein